MTTTATRTTRGRPPLSWLEPDRLTELDTGTAISVETHGKHTARTVGRIVALDARHLDLNTPYGMQQIPLHRVKRARVVPALYEPGDPVVLRGISEARWRGGVVRTSGTDVLVEQIDGAFAWHAEDSLEPPDTREQKPAPFTRARA